MADAKKCDRCGMYYDNYERNICENDFDGLEKASGLRLIDQRNRQSGANDMCPSCMEKFIKWWEEGKHGENDKKEIGQISE